MTLLEALVLGIVQGATEFLPISSSGHLVLVPWLLGWSKPGLAFSALLHWGTVLAVLVVFHRDLYQLLVAGLTSLRTRSLLVAGLTSLRTRSLEDPQARVAWWIVLGTIPAAIIGYLFQDFFEALFSKPIIVAIFLLITSIVLWTSERVGAQNRTTEGMSWLDALLVGLAQAAAIAPGISRSGVTISAGLLLGVKRASAARFSFLLMVPATLGAGILSLIELASEGVLVSDLPLLAIGFLAAAITGYLAIRWLLVYLTRRPLTIFALYCASVGLGGLLLSVLRG